jgi:hypothetical protein
VGILREYKAKRRIRYERFQYNVYHRERGTDEMVPKKGPPLISVLPEMLAALSVHVANDLITLEFVGKFGKKRSYVAPTILHHADIYPRHTELSHHIPQNCRLLNPVRC